MLLVVGACCLCLAGWVGPSERQREAVAALRALDGCNVYYDFDPEGPEPDLARLLCPAAMPADQQGWIATIQRDRDQADEYWDTD